MPATADFGHYRLDRLLGAGGMGEVYLARDLTLDRDVALKLLPVDMAADGDARRRLLREAQAAAKLDHPHICQVFEVGEAPDGRAFIAMSYVEGETLAARLGRGPLPQREALAIARDVADALGAAHAQGIIHRDLKPQNVMITPSGRPRLLDFGLAKLRAPGARAPDATTAASDPTQPGMLLGTPAYMSPEQVGGEDLDGRSDLFALGALLFECLTGRRAFEGNSVMSILGAIAHVHPPLVSALRPGTPPELDQLCARLLAKDPVDRFQTAEEVVGALRLLLPATHRTSASLHRLPAPKMRGWQLSARVALVFVLAAGWIYQSAEPLPAPTAEAERWYRRGTDFIREGAFHSASAALEQAIRQFPVYPLAYARLAEALAELDDQSGATAQLVRLQDALGDESRLSDIDRLRLQAVRSLVLRDLPRAVEGYRELVARTADDAEAWVDLGRTQEMAERRGEARASYERALAINRDLAAAHVRLASIDGRAGRRTAALSSFAEGERLYRASSNVEGATEVLLRRGAFLDERGELALARRDLEQAVALASNSGAIAQAVRARLALASVTASEGRVADAEAMANEAIHDATRAELWTLVADGLIDLGGLLVNEPARRSEADRRLLEAIELATRRGALRTAARATLQRAALTLQGDNPGTAKELAESTLPFFSEHGYRRFELTALTIAGRARRNLDDLAGARKAAADVLQAARELDDAPQVALALTSLAGVASAAGDFPAALEARRQAEAIHRQLGDEESLPFDLTNQAELLIQMGRGADAEPLLTALDEGIRAGLDNYVGRANHVTYLRTFSAMVIGNHALAVGHAGGVLAADQVPKSTQALAGAMLGYARAALRHAAPAGGGGHDTASLTPDVIRELHYWRALEAQARGEHARSLGEARTGVALARRVSNDELGWRLAAVGYLAAAALDQDDVVGQMDLDLSTARARLAKTWGGAIGSYEARPDLREILRQVDRTRSSRRGTRS